MAELRIYGNSSHAPQFDSSRTRPRLRASISVPLLRLLEEPCTVCVATSLPRQRYVRFSKCTRRVEDSEALPLLSFFKLTPNNLICLSLDQYLLWKTSRN